PTLVGLARRGRAGRGGRMHPNVRIGLVPDAEYRDRLHDVMSQSTIVKASNADLAWLYPDLTYERAAEQILGEGPSLVVVTLGALGAFGAHRDLRLGVDAVQVHVVDTIGAGDA